MSRSRNHSCSCYLCQPHKKGKGGRYKPSERRKLNAPEQQLAELDAQAELDQQDIHDQETTLALYCELYGPCQRCRGQEGKT